MGKSVLGPLLIFSNECTNKAAEPFSSTPKQAHSGEFISLSLGFFTFMM